MHKYLINRPTVLSFSGSLVIYAERGGSEPRNERTKELFLPSHNGGSVTKNFRYALHHFRGVVAHADDAIGAHCGRMLRHALERVGTRLLAQLRKQRDVTAHQRLQARSH